MMHMQLNMWYHHMSIPGDMSRYHCIGNHRHTNCTSRCISTPRMCTEIRMMWRSNLALPLPHRRQCEDQDKSDHHHSDQHQSCVHRSWPNCLAMKLPMSLLPQFA